MENMNQEAARESYIKDQEHAEEAALILDLWEDWQKSATQGRPDPRRYFPEFLEKYRGLLTGPDPETAPYSLMFMGFCGGLDVATLPGRTTTETAPNIERVQMLEYFDAAAYDTHGATSKPHGRAWVPIVLDIVDQIFTYMNPADITEADLDQLTADNFHTARHAAEIAIYLNKYII